jgi:hypothetical protein
MTGGLTFVGGGVRPSCADTRPSLRGPSKMTSALWSVRGQVYVGIGTTYHTYASTGAEDGVVSGSAVDSPRSWPERRVCLPFVREAWCTMSARPSSWGRRSSTLRACGRSRAWASTSPTWVRNPPPGTAVAQLAGFGSLPRPRLADCGSSPRTCPARKVGSCSGWAAPLSSCRGRRISTDWAGQFSSGRGVLSWGDRRTSRSWALSTSTSTTGSRCGTGGGLRY